VGGDEAAHLCGEEGKTKDRLNWWGKGEGSVATVHFYTHETLEAANPSSGIGQRLRRWLVRKVSPRFGHCAVFDLGQLEELNYTGYRKSPPDAPYMHRDANSVRVEIPTIADMWRLRSTRCIPLKMVLAYFLPRRFDNCASYVGRLVYCPGARTPDELYRLLLDKEAA
jgi:hypothetical protein